MNNILAAPGGRYGVLYADPPWDYRDRNKAGGRTLRYRTMTTEQIKALPVPGLAEAGAAMFLWITMPNIPVGMEVLAAWGFRFSTVAFTWTKLNRKPLSVKGLRQALRENRTIIYYQGEPYTTFMGQGRNTRGNAEIVLLGFNGRCPPRARADVRSEVLAPLREHSRKPDEVRDRIVDLYGPARRLELFARDRHPGFDAWGDQVK